MKNPLHLPTIYVAIACGLACFPAFAGPCPDDFSFVDFGQFNTDRSITPGGPTFRVVLDGQTLLENPPTCHSFSDGMAPLTDNAGDPIPLVPTMGYDATAIAANLDRIGLTHTNGQAARLAAMNSPLREALENDPNVDRTTGAGFVCYSLAYAMFPSIVCDLDNPFDSAKPIMMSCEADNCSIIQITMSDHMVAHADWHASTGGYDTPHAAGRDGASIVSGIHTFLTKHMIN